MTILNLILLFIVSSISGIGATSEEWQTHQPIVAATLVGLALGDIKTGIIVGAAVQLIAIGWMTVGAATPPDPALAGTVSAVLAIVANVKIGVATGIAVPVAVAGQLLLIVQLSTIQVAIVYLGDKFAKKGNTAGIDFAHWLTAVPSALRVAIPTTLIAWVADANFAKDFFNSLPKFLTGGLQVASGFLCVVGYAMVLKQINKKTLLPFFFLGFIIMTFSKSMTLIALSIIGICLSIIYYLFLDKSNQNTSFRRNRNSRVVSATGEKKVINNSDENVKNSLLTKKDLFKVFIRTQFYQLSWTYERFQNLCYCYCMVPILKKLYPEKRDLSAALVRHMEYFNTNPMMASPVLGVNAAMEEAGITDKNITEEAITSMKVALMGPGAGIGDSVFWGIFRPTFAAIGAGIATNGSILGPIFFFVAFNVVRLLTRYYGLYIPYQQGTSFLNAFRGKEQQFINAISVLAYVVIGGLVARWTTITLTSKLYSVKVNGKQVTQTLQMSLDNIMPNLMPLLLTFLVYYLLKKNIKPVTIILILMFIGVLGYSMGILG